MDTFGNTFKKDRIHRFEWFLHCMLCSRPSIRGNDYGLLDRELCSKVVKEALLVLFFFLACNQVKKVLQREQNIVREQNLFHNEKKGSNGNKKSSRTEFVPNLTKKLLKGRTIFAIMIFKWPCRTYRS